MKNYLKQKVQEFLAQASRRILAKYKPRIIGITGSVGKTSTKEAVYVVVAQKYRTRKSEKNYNNEFGLPLTIIGADSPGSNAFGWLKVYMSAQAMIWFQHSYPEVLILEMGIDRPGDMDYLVSIARPDIAIVTTIGMSHYEFFPDVAAIEHEKGKIVEAVGATGNVILNADNEVALRQRIKSQAPVTTYGRSEGSTIHLQKVEEVLTDKLISALEISRPDAALNLQIPAVGTAHTSAVLAAVSVAAVMQIEDSFVQRGVMEYRPAPGRLNVISGIKHSVIIDDTYNAAPDSMREALSLLARLPNTHKIAVLGDMLELGGISDSAHEAVGNSVAELKLDYLITVGPAGKIIADSAKESGMAAERILSFDTSDEARKTVQSLLQPESAVLIKGSQGVRMEKITKEIMAEPMRASELLCRQYGDWIS